MQGSRFEVFSPAVIQLSKAVQCIRSRKLAEYDLKGTNAMCLCNILDSEQGGLTATQLAKVCDIDKAQVSRAMAELTDLGLVFRDDEGGRRYKQKYQLTEKGKAAAIDIEDTAARIQQTLRRGLKAEELDAFYAVLTKICDNFSNVLEDLA